MLWDLYYAENLLILVG